MGRPLRGDDSGARLQELWPARELRRFGFAHPGFLREPFVLGSAYRAKNAGEENRHGIEARAVGNDAGCNFAPRVRTFDHDGAHEKLPIPEDVAWEQYRVVATLI